MPILHLLYSQKFESSGNVLVILSIAVIFRAVSWVYGTVIIATKDARVLLISDLGLNAGLLLSIGTALQKYNSLESLGWAFVFSNFIYFIFVVEYARYKNGLMLRRDIWPLVTLAVFPLILMAVGAQSFYSVHGMVLMTFLMVGLTMSFASWHAYKKVSS
jgi:O-antigen/teichoic acid export membrane protein